MVAMYHQSLSPQLRKGLLLRPLGIKSPGCFESEHAQLVVYGTYVVHSATRPSGHSTRGGSVSSWDLQTPGTGRAFCFPFLF